MKFKITAPRKAFKSEEAYLANIYDTNPSISAAGVTKNQFILQSKSYKAVYETSINSAVKKYSESTVFTPYTERATNNIISALKSFGQLKPLTTMIRDERGHFTQFDKTQLRWDRDLGGYVYMGKVFIDVTNSPENITLSRL